jgi:hypothetical protein
MQFLVGDFKLPCACKMIGCKLRLEVINGSAHLGCECPTCGARIMERLDRLDTIFAAGVDLRNGLSASGLTWPPKEN